MWDTYPARVADALAGKPWSDGVPGDWVTGDRILDVTLLPVFFAFAFVALRRMLVNYLFEVRAVAAGQSRRGKSVWGKSTRAVVVCACANRAGSTCVRLCSGRGGAPGADAGAA